jgi:hypothetical protein
MHWRQEGELVRQGLNIYPPKDTGSIGGILRIGNRMLSVRYSKITKQWHTGYIKHD